MAYWWHVPAGNPSGLWSALVTLGLFPLQVGPWVSAGGASCWQGFLPLAPLVSNASVLGCLAGSPWDVEAVRAHGVDPPGAEKRSSACLAFPGITEEKKIVFPTPTENAKSEVFLHKIASLLNPICLPPPHPTAPAAAGEIQGRVIKHCG